MANRTHNNPEIGSGSGGHRPRRQPCGSAFPEGRGFGAWSRRLGRRVVAAGIAAALITAGAGLLGAHWTSGATIRASERAASEASKDRSQRHQDAVADRAQRHQDAVADRLQAQVVADEKYVEKVRAECRRGEARGALCVEAGRAHERAARRHLSRALRY
jgi:hypothetical protein